MEQQLVLLTQGDDFGSNETATNAIMEAHLNGILRNASVMVVTPYIEEAAARYAKVDSLCWGLHLVINAEWDQVKWGPAAGSDKVPTLVDEQGYFYQSPAVLKAKGVDLADIMTELDAQLAKMRSLGFHVSYADTHMRFDWIDEKLPSMIEQWCRREGLIFYKPYDRRLPEAGDGLIDPVESLLARLEAADATASSYLLLGHPGYDNEELRRLGHDGYPGETVAKQCDLERRLFMDKRVVDYCRSGRVRLATYAELST